jgi:amino acid transporter
MVILVGTMIVLAMWLIVTVSSQHPGTVGRLTSVRSIYPLVYGYMNMFKIGYNQSLIFCVIPCFGTCWAMIYVITKQLQSMASSGLLPEFLLYTVTKDKIPVLCYFIVCLSAYFATCYFSAVDRFVAGSQIATLAGVIVYISMFYCYLVFKCRFSHMDRTFKNPLSYFSVVTGIAVFVFGFFYVFVVGVLLFFLFYLTVIILYYFCWVRSRQKFSNTEQEVFFKAYVLKSKFFLFYDPVFYFLLCFAYLCIPVSAC